MNTPKTRAPLAALWLLVATACCALAYASAQPAVEASEAAPVFKRSLENAKTNFERKGRLDLKQALPADEMHDSVRRVVDITGDIVRCAETGADVCPPNVTSDPSCDGATNEGTCEGQVTCVPGGCGPTSSNVTCNLAATCYGHTCTTATCTGQGCSSTINYSCQPTYQGNTCTTGTCATTASTCSGPSCASGTCSHTCYGSSINCRP